MLALSESMIDGAVRGLDVLAVFFQFCKFCFWLFASCYFALKYMRYYRDKMPISESWAKRVGVLCQCIKSVSYREDYIPTLSFGKYGQRIGIYHLVGGKWQVITGYADGVNNYMLHVVESRGEVRKICEYLGTRISE